MNQTETKKKDYAPDYSHLPRQERIEMILRDSRDEANVQESESQKTESKQKDASSTKNPLTEMKDSLIDRTPDWVLRTGRSIGSGLLDIADFAQLVGNVIGAPPKYVADKLADFLTGEERDFDFSLPQNAEKFRKWFKENVKENVGDDTVFDDAVRFASSLVGGGQARKGLQVSGKIAASVASKVAPKVLEKIKDVPIPKALEKTGKFLTEAMFPKYTGKEKLAKDTAIGVTGLKAGQKAAEETGEFLKDKDYSDGSKTAAQIAASIVGSLGGSLSASLGLNASKNILKNKLSEMIDLDKIKIRQEHGLPIEIAQVLKTDHPLTPTLKFIFQHAADEPLLSGKTHKTRAEMLSKIQDWLIPEGTVRNEHEVGKTIKKAFKKKAKEESEMFEEHIAESGLIKKNKDKIETKVTTDQKQKFSDLSAAEKLKLVNAIRKDKKMSEKFLERFGEGSDEILDDVLQEAIKATKQKFKPYSVLDIDQRSQELKKLREQFPDRMDEIDKLSGDKKYKAWDELRSTENYSKDVNLEDIVKPNMTESVISGAQKHEFTPGIKALINDFNLAKKNLTPEDFYTFVKRSNKIQQSVKNEAEQNYFIRRFQESLKNDLIDHLSATDATQGTTRGASYEKAREFWKEARENAPSNLIHDEIKNKVYQHKDKGVFDVTYQDLVNGEAVITPYILDKLDDKEAKMLLGQIFTSMGGKKQGKFVNVKALLDKIENMNIKPRSAIEALAEKAYGQKIDFKGLQSITDDLSTITKYGNFSGTGRTMYLNSINDKLGDEVEKIVKDVGKSGTIEFGKIAKNVTGAILKVMPKLSLLGLDSANVDQSLIKSLENLAKSTNPNQFRKTLFDMGKDKTIPTDVANSLIRTLNRTLNKKDDE